MALQWYVLQVMTGTEAECRRKAAEAGFEAVAPTRILPERRGSRWDEREIVMLPGYVFVACGGTVAEYYRLAAIPDAIRLLPGKGEYTPVPDGQMAWILELSNRGRPWGISTAVNLPDFNPSNSVPSGQTLSADKVSSANADGKLKVLSGPLIGRERMILNWDRRRRRAKIRVDVLNRTRLIDVGLMEEAQR